MTVRVFGIRHHGPGSARALAASLQDWTPDAVLVEGPPEADAVLGLAGLATMRPPVALLGYLRSRPARAAFWPLSAWSPEWVAVQYALTRHVMVKMIDLPAAVMLAGPTADDTSGPAQGDPLARLAEAAGYDDTERWWEDMVEHRHGEEPWDAIAEAVAELRAVAEEVAGTEARREASMRQHIRTAEKIHHRVAVVCGAWHAPALLERGPARPDQQLLARLPRQKAAVTWVPWTNSRLSFASGYGAGVTSPGWYEHLFVSPDRPIERWMIKVAGLLRAEQIDAPPASVIDAVRLAQALAVMRGRPLAGLSECTDAARASLTGGRDGGLALIERKLVVGDVVGEVPPETPMVALAADLVALQRRLRLQPLPTTKTVDLDLRKDTDLERSRLLHRLDLLEVPWGVVDFDSRGTGTFRETWSLRWQPELAVRVIEASFYGTTVEAAATARAVEAAGRQIDVRGVTTLIERCLLADLPGAVSASMAALDERAALTSDIAELMGAVPPLARVLRYGTVRRTDAEAIDKVVRGLVARVCVSLRPSCASLDDDAATHMTARISALSAALGNLDDRGLRDMWLDALHQLGGSPTLPGLLAGRTARILLDAGRIDVADVADRLSAALSPGEDPARGAGWVEGLVTGSGLLLVHDRALLAVIDAWLTAVSEEAFEDVVPLLRRSFAGFEPGERRLIAEAAGRLDGRGPVPSLGSPSLGLVDEERAAAVLPLLRMLLGGGEQRHE